MCNSMSYKSNTSFIWNLLWIILIIPTRCETGTQSISEDSLKTEVISTTTSIIRTPPQSMYKPLVLCECYSGEVINETGQCQPWKYNITVPMEPSVPSYHRAPVHVDIKEFNVLIKVPQCQNQIIDLQEDQFHLRLRGDLLGTKGAERGLRVKDYCIQHQLIGGQVKVTAKGCVSLPVIHRCCPRGKYMKDGECVENALTNVPFIPPLATGPFGVDSLAGAPFPWADRKEYVDKLSCSSEDAMSNVELDGQNAYIFALPETVILTWKPKDDQRKSRTPQQYCVDVPGDDGTYYAYTCQKDLEVYCNNTMCTNKCCNDGEAISLSTSQCISSNLTFTPPFPSPPSSLNTLYGFPSCVDSIHITNFDLSQNGTLIQGDNSYPFMKFCMDYFIEDSSAKIGAIVCINKIPETTWRNIKKEMYPVSIGLSCFFLFLLLILNLWIPKLRENEGKYQLFHAASLFIAYLVNLIFLVLVPKGYINADTCVALAFVMQFAYLSAFFWLSTMCFDVWRLFRSLACNMFNPVRSVATWKYLLYAVGGPISITVITMIVQFVGPIDGSVPGLVHPGIGEGRCWFKGTIELLLYFYGPLAVLLFTNFIFLGTTYNNLRIIRGDYNPHEYTIGSAETTRTYDFFEAFWQRFYLLALAAGCWFGEIISWQYPVELWAATDIFNNLQGVFVFLLFLTHHNKRALLKEKLPKIFHFSDICINHAQSLQTTINDSNKKLSKTISSSSIISNISLFSVFSTSSFNLNNTDLSDSSNTTHIRDLSLIRKVSTTLNPIIEQ